MGALRDIPQQARSREGAPCGATWAVTLHELRGWAWAWPQAPEGTKTLNLTPEVRAIEDKAVQLSHPVA